MNLSTAKQLQRGDEVTWTDPNNGECSRTLTINMISVTGDVVRIVDTDGEYLECFASELS